MIDRDTAAHMNQHKWRPAHVAKGSRQIILIMDEANREVLHRVEAASIDDALAQAKQWAETRADRNMTDTEARKALREQAEELERLRSQLDTAEPGDKQKAKGKRTQPESEPSASMADIGS